MTSCQSRYQHASIRTSYKADTNMFQLGPIISSDTNMFQLGPLIRSDTNMFQLGPVVRSDTKCLN